MVPAGDKLGVAELVLSRGWEGRSAHGGEVVRSASSEGWEQEGGGRGEGGGEGDEEWWWEGQEEEWGANFASLR